MSAAGLSTRLMFLHVGQLFTVEDEPYVCKILAKSPGAIHVEIRRKRREIDYGVIPYREVQVERVERTTISPLTIVVPKAGA